MGPHTSPGSRRGDTQLVLDGIRRIVQVLRESSRHAERTLGLSGAQIFVLQKLAGSPRLSVNELAALTHTHQSSVSIVVARLAERGLVRRLPCAEDARKVELSLTAEGRRLAGTAPDAPQDRLIAGIARLSSTRRRQLATALADLAVAMNVTGRAPMFFEERKPSPARKPQQPRTAVARLESARV